MILTLDQIHKIGCVDKELEDAGIERVSIPRAFNLFANEEVSIYVCEGYERLVTWRGTRCGPIYDTTIVKKPSTWRLYPTIVSPYLIIDTNIMDAMAILQESDNLEVQSYEDAMIVSAPIGYLLELDLLPGKGGIRFSLLKVS